MQRLYITGIQVLNHLLMEIKNKGLLEILKLGIVLFMRIFREKDSFTGIVKKILNIYIFIFIYINLYNILI